MKTIIIKILQTTMFWNILNGIISLLITNLTSLPYTYMPFILWALSLVTKELNKKFNPFYDKTLTNN